MRDFTNQFRSLMQTIQQSERVLLFAHTRPDSDTYGSNVTMREYLIGQGKQADIVCFDPCPPYLTALVSAEFSAPDQLDPTAYDMVIACDSVDRGFDRIRDRLRVDQTVALMDHHPDIAGFRPTDIVMIDAEYSSTCEIVFNFLEYSKADITAKMATALMTGLVGDTGNFQHSCTTPRVLEIAAMLMKKGAPLSKIVDAVFINKKISTLKLWGRAFQKAKIDERSGMIVSALTLQDIAECDATTEDVNQVATILNSVPGTRFSLIFFQQDTDTIKGSLRSEEYKGVNVSEIAHQFGGGGHRLASGFEMKGKIVETEEGWQVV